MLKYTLKRVIGMIPTLIIVITFVFFFIQLIPGDPARMIAGEQATLEDVEAVRENLGLNKPIYVQYFKYLEGLLKGDLGTSLSTKRPVAQEIASRYVNTMQLTIVSLIWATVVGVLMGVWSGKNRGKWQDFTGITAAVGPLYDHRAARGVLLRQQCRRCIQHERGCARAV